MMFRSEHFTYLNNNLMHHCDWKLLQKQATDTGFEHTNTWPSELTVVIDITYLQNVFPEVRNLMKDTGIF
jgi:hypothetical protein